MVNYRAFLAFRAFNATADKPHPTIKLEKYFLRQPIRISVGFHNVGNLL
jgi:hypothetical protein